jgi:hypothetical protein
MPVIELEDVEWQQVLSMISLGPWRDANPLLMKIGQQLRLQAQRQQEQAIKQHGIKLDADGKEIRQ